MKLYRKNGTFYEKQADVPKGGAFETVEFPFAASPKADFVDWMNGFSGMASAAPEQPTLPERAEELPVDRYIREAGQQASAPREFFGAHHPLTTLTIEDWCGKAQPHQLGHVVSAAALRLQQIAQEQEKSMK